MTATRQPDILDVITDLSNDEVRTSPAIANRVLDLLPDEVWQDETLRWLDPGCKTGSFLREAAKRLLVGLREKIPDENERLEHILKNMLFGIAITDLTAMMSRRTLYCSKDAAGEKSIVTMASHDGNIIFGEYEHDFSENNKCVVCGASRDGALDSFDKERHAYAFIHSNGFSAVSEVMDMDFDIIVGNPPYQMDGGGGGTNATPIYHEFVRQAKALEPKHIAMVTPSRWMAGGRGLGEYREEMLADRRIRKIVDFLDASELFPGVSITGGVSFFHWQSDYQGECDVSLMRDGSVVSRQDRKLNDFDVFVRDSRALNLLERVLEKDDGSVADLISGDTPFGFASNFGFRVGERRLGDVKILGLRNGRRAWGNVTREECLKNTDLIDEWKVFVPKARGGTSPPDVVLGSSEIGGPGTVCTQTFLAVGRFDTEDEARSFQSYLRTRFFRFLVSLRKIGQDAMGSTYTWVPMQTWDREWTDEILYEMYEVTEDEQTFIAEMIKEMPS